MRMTKLLRSKKGMTLMELMVALAVVTVLIPVISVCLFSAMRQYAWTKSYADMCGVVSAIDGTVERELSLASGLRMDGNAIVFVKNGAQTRRMETLPSGNGDDALHVLFIDGTPILDAAFYNDVSVTAEFEIQADNAVLVTLTYTGASTYVSAFIVEKL